LSFVMPAIEPDGNQISIDTSTIFSTNINGTNYLFSPRERVYSTATNRYYSFENVNIYEGSFVTITYTATGNLNETFLINNSNIDLSTISVTVQSSSTNTVVTPYTLISDITTLTPTTNIFYLFETTNGTYEIQFGDGVLGSKLTSGNIVNITFQTTSADAANGASSFVLANNINGEPYYSRYNISYTNVVPSYGGEPGEGIESIRLNALQNFRVQGRAVTASDYKFFLERDYPFASTISVWGGQDANPPQYGKVFFSFKPVTGYFLTNAEKADVLSIIKNYNMVSIIPEIVDPTYIFIEPNVSVTYNQAATILNAGQIKSSVIATIQNFNDTTLTTFGTSFVYSKFVADIDNSDPSIIGNLTQIDMRVNFPVTLNVSLQYTIDFQNGLHPGTLRNKSSFQAANDTTLNSGTQNLYIDDYTSDPTNPTGVVRIYTYVTTGNVTNKIYLNNNAGTIDYINGIVVLNKFKPSLVNSADGTFDLIARPTDYSIGNIVSQRNTILTINPADIVVNVTAQ